MDAEGWLEEGRSLRRLGQVERALAVLRGALEQWRQDPAEARSVVACHVEIGVTLRQTHRADEALTHLDEALRLYEAIPGADRDRACCLNEIGQALGDRTRYSEATVRHEQALVLLRRLPDTAREQAFSHMKIGGLRYLMGQHEGAIQEHEKALSLFRSVSGSEPEQAECLSSAGTSLRRLRRHRESLEQHQAARALVQDLPDVEALQARILKRIGAVHGEMGRYEAAIEVLEESLALHRRVPHSELAQAIALSDVGTALACLGRHAESNRRHDEVLAIYRQIPGTERDQARSHLVISHNLIAMGRYEAAIEQVEQARALFAGIPGTLFEQAVCLHNICQALTGWGRYEEAVSRADESLVLLDEIRGPAKERAVAHRIAADAWRLQGHPAVARERYARALALFDPEQDRDELWQAYHGAGQAHEACGAARAALSAYLSAAEFLERLRDDVATHANKLTFFQDKAMIYGRLIALLLEGDIADPIGAEPRLARFGDRPEVMALALAEAAKARVLSDLLQERDFVSAAPEEWIAEQQRVGNEISWLHAELQALGREPGEQGRLLRDRIQSLETERDILEVRIKRAAPLNASSAVFPGLAAIQDILEPETALLEYALLPEPVRRADGSGVVPPESSVPPAPGQRLALWVATRTGLDAFVLTLPAGNSTATLAQMVRRLRLQPETLGLEERIRLYRYPMERRLRTQGQMSVAEHQRAGRLLAEALFPPAVCDYLAARGVRQLAIVPDGILHHVPFSALILQEDPERSALPRYEACRYLVHDYAVTCVPSATALASLRQTAAERRAKASRRRRSVLAFADPVFSATDPRSAAGTAAGSPPAATSSDSSLAGYYRERGVEDHRLPASAEEARRAAALFPDFVIHESAGTDTAALGASRLALGGPERQSAERQAPSAALSAPPQSEVYLGLAATRERLRSLPLDEFRYLIFATHAHVDEEHPMLSCIRLSASERESGFLPAREILELRLDADLVTLSACQSGLGRLARGEGIVGLSLAFFSAGARSLVTSLWKVVDQPTAILVERLHAHLRGGNISRAEALRRAQHDVMTASPDYAHPFFWAFSLVGDGV